MGYTVKADTTDIQTVDSDTDYSRQFTKRWKRNGRPRKSITDHMSGDGGGAGGREEQGLGQREEGDGGPEGEDSSAER